MVEDSFVEDIMDAFFQKHEMLTFLCNWELGDEDNASKIAHYIGGTIRENKKES